MNKPPFISSLVSRRPHERREEDGTQQLLFWLTAAFIVKAAFLCLDHTPRLFLGDSASYIATAVSGWIPPDRSFAYGFIIRLFTAWSHNLTVLVGFQVAASWIALSLVVISLRAIAGPQHSLWVVTLVLACAPIQLLYERYVMTETISGLLFSLTFCFVSRYIIRPRLMLLAVLGALGMAAAALRITLVPGILVSSVLLPVAALTPKSPWRKKNWSFATLQKLGVHVLISCSFTAVGLTAYQKLYSHISGAPPAFHSRQGYFLLATVSPLVTPDAVGDSRLEKAIWAPGGLDTKNPTLRNAQMFMAEGMLPRMERVLGDPVLVDRTARRIAVRAIETHPTEFLALGFTSASPYTKRTELMNVASVDMGDREIPPDLSELLKAKFGFAAAATTSSPSIITRYFSSALIWYQVLIFCAVPVAVILAALALVAFGTLESRLGILVAANLAVGVGIAIFLSPAPSIRYLHTTEFLFPIAIFLTTFLYKRCRMPALPPANLG